MIKVMLARELGDSAREKMSEIFVNGFIQWLEPISKDVGKLTRAFAHMFNLDLFYVAVVDGEIAGIAACTDGKALAAQLSLRELCKYLGIMRGLIAGLMLKKEFEQHPYPFTIEPCWGAVEYVATDSKYRGIGVASAIIMHIFSATPNNSYVLEVANTNLPAVKLYEKLGFREFTRVPHKYSKYSGINYLVYMKYDKIDN